jgi:hypothetical protein
VRLKAGDIILNGREIFHLIPEDFEHIGNFFGRHRR